VEIVFIPVSLFSSDLPWLSEVDFCRHRYKSLVVRSDIAHMLPNSHITGEHVTALNGRVNTH